MNDSARSDLDAAPPGPARPSGPPASTRAALLTAARTLFARRGYDGASVRAITRAAHANLGAVSYHFGSKQALYHAVLEQVLAPLGARVSAAVAEEGGALDRAERVVRALFAHLEENPDMSQLMLQEIAAGKNPPPPVAHTLRETSRRLEALMREGQESGEIRAGDPRLQGLSLVYQPVHLTLIQRIARDVIDLDQTSPATRSRVIEHAAAFVRAGLMRRGDEQ